MTDAYNAGREAGIREAAEAVRQWKYHDDAPEIIADILALLDAPAPAGVTVQEAICEITDADYANIIAHLSPELTPTGPIPNRNSLMMEAVRLRNKVNAALSEDRT
jgi:hypothetical protein